MCSHLSRGYFQRQPPRHVPKGYYDNNDDNKKGKSSIRLIYIAFIIAFIAAFITNLLIKGI